jgi:phage protein D
LIDGIITNHQIATSNSPGGSTLIVTGEDISRRLDLKDKNKTFKNQSDSEIVETILRDYREYGLKAEVTRTDTRRQENEGNTTQHDTDFNFIQDLAKRNGFVFYVEPTRATTITTAHWGPQNDERPPQPALSMNMGPNTNLESLNFGYDALGPATPEISVLDSRSKRLLPISVPGQLQAPLVRQPAASLRKTNPRNTANKDAAQAGVQAKSLTASSSDAVTASGELDALRYGLVLRARHLVDVRGVGDSYNGRYYVKEVTHRLKRGEYKQSFTLSRGGHGALYPVVVT